MANGYMRTLMFLAGTSKNFSDMKQPNGEPFDAGDDGEEEKGMFATLQADAYLLNLLVGLNDRQKIILMYQLLRESGYNLNHADCARTLSITRERYMILLKEVRQRSAKILQISLD